MTFDTALQDLKFAVRSLLKRPGFTSVAVFSLALGVGANSAIFSLVNGLFFKKPALTQPSELIEIYRLVRGEDHFFVSHRDVEDLAISGAELFTGVTAYKFFVGQVGGEGGGGQVVAGELVSGNYFDLLGVRAALGRTFVAEEDVTPETHPVVVLGHRLWQGRFAADRSIVGRTIRLNGRQYTVVGVVPESFPGRVMAFLPDVWVPMMMENHLYPSGFDNNNLGMTARLRPGVTPARVQATIQALGERIDEERGYSNRTWEFVAVWYDDMSLSPQIDGPITAMAIMLLSVVGLVLLITCSNLASFLLARAADGLITLGKRHVAETPRSGPGAKDSYLTTLRCPLLPRTARPVLRHALPLAQRGVIARLQQIPAPRARGAVSDQMPRLLSASATRPRVADRVGCDSSKSRVAWESRSRSEG